MLGGTVGNEFAAHDGTEVRVQGLIGDGFEAFAGTVVTVDSGVIGEGFQSHDEVVLNGGTILSNFTAHESSIVRMAGGFIESGFTANDGSQLLLSGGVIDSGIVAKAGSLIHINGYAFTIDGELQDVPLDASIEITQRDVQLGGFLDSGQAFSFFLNSSYLRGTSSDYFHPDATVIITATQPIPEPTTGVVVLAGVILLGLPRRACGNVTRI